MRRPIRRGRRLRARTLYSPTLAPLQLYIRAMLLRATSARRLSDFCFPALSPLRAQPSAAQVADAPLGPPRAQRALSARKPPLHCSLPARGEVLLYASDVMSPLRSFARSFAGSLARTNASDTAAAAGLLFPWRLSAGSKSVLQHVRSVGPLRRVAGRTPTLLRLYEQPDGPTERGPADKPTSRQQTTAPQAAEPARTQASVPGESAAFDSRLSRGKADPGPAPLLRLISGAFNAMHGAGEAIRGNINDFLDQGGDAVSRRVTRSSGVQAADLSLSAGCRPGARLRFVS